MSIRLGLIIIASGLLWPSQASSNNNNQSLLWEISGNGLNKKSYLYGTMHISDRVSYHLSDAFFEHLLAADIVAVESHFDEWAALDEMLNVPENLFYQLFYSNFRMHPIRRNEILTHFSGINYSINNLLYRTSPQGQDFQEETYLDMFIFQVGKKYGKKTVGLESAKESYILISNLDFEDFEIPSEEKIQELTRLMRDRSPEQALADFYREKDLDLMLRFMELALPKKWIEAMLYKRNEIMVNSIDSLARTGSIFATMGAAHLPGDRGAIEMLRQIGYTVMPVHGEYTSVGREKKAEIDEFFLEPQFKTHSTFDGMVTLPMFDFLLYNLNNTSSPDLTNGGSINLKRTPLNDFVAEKHKRFGHLSLDSLFFENIPGQILSKDFVRQENLAFYDIKNKTRSGNTQRYRFYITPLELVTVSMVGPGEYSDRYNNEVFSNITIKTQTEEWNLVEPNRGGFKVSMPVFRAVYGDQPDPTYPQDIEVQAFDPSNNSYYFLSKKIPSDFVFEDTAFELERIQTEFYMQHDVIDFATLDKQENTFISKGKIHGKDIYLKTVVEGNVYYLLGCVECNSKQKQKFFESFETKPPTNDWNYQVYKDVNHLFSIDLPYKQNETIFLANTLKERTKPKEKDEWFSSKSQSYTFSSVNGSKVDLFVYQYHPYESEKSVDSLFFRLNKRFISDSWDDEEAASEYDDFEIDMDFLAESADFFPELMEPMADQGSNFYSVTSAGPVVSSWDDLLELKDKREYQLVNRNQYYVEDGDFHIFEATARRDGTLTEQRRKIIFKDGIRYTLTAAVPINYQNDNTFVERLFDSFLPTDTVLENSVFDNKLSLFLTHVQSNNDSIRSSALNSLRFLDLDKSNLPEIEELLDVLEINNQDVVYIKTLLEKVAEIDDPTVMQFVIETYHQENLNTSLKISILKGLAKQKDHEVYEKILELLEIYLPIPERHSEIESLFKAFGENLEYSTGLIPNIFEYFTIEEYKNPILDFCKKLVESEYFEPESLEPFKQMLLTNANLEFRRVRSWANNRRSQKESTSGNDALNAASRLNTYLNLIHPFTEEQRFADWWQNVAKLQIPETLLVMLNLELEGERLGKTLANEMLELPQTKFAVWVLLSAKAPKFKLPKVSEMDMARSAVLLIDHVDLEKQDLDFFKTQTHKHNDKTIKFFFFKCKDKETPSWQAEETILMSIGFVLDEKYNIIPRAFFSGLQMPIIDKEKMDEYIFEIIDYSIYGNKMRATHDKDDFSFNPYDGLGF